MVVNIADIVWRRGWKSMMTIMIPVWPINATYMGPLTLYMYFKYGRPSNPESAGSHHNHAEMDHSNDKSVDNGNHHQMGQSDHSDMDHSHHGHSHESSLSQDVEKQKPTDPNRMDLSSHHMHEHMTDGRPMWATVFIGVSHCGAGCVLGDIVGEWLVYGTGATINGHDVWAMLLIDYGFALLFGIVFQYFSIAPMSGEYGLQTLFRAAKADILSLTAFELGLFGWMIAYQVGIWDYKLRMDNATYWWMMQVGMLFGFWTAVPVNWWLFKKKIKEPCA